MKIGEACLCGNCEEVFSRRDSRVCPICTSPHHLMLGTILKRVNECEATGAKESIPMPKEPIPTTKK
jgi:hypothetical protein